MTETQSAPEQQISKMQRRIKRLGVVLVLLGVFAGFCSLAFLHPINPLIYAFIIVFIIYTVTGVSLLVRNKLGYALFALTITITGILIGCLVLITIVLILPTWVGLYILLLFIIPIGIMVTLTALFSVYLLYAYKFLHLPATQDYYFSEDTSPATECDSPPVVKKNLFASRKLIITMLVLLPLLGVPLMWLHEKKWSKNIRICITLICVPGIFFTSLFWILLVTGSVNPSLQTTSIPNYKIPRITSTGSTYAERKAASDKKLEAKYGTLASHQLAMKQYLETKYAIRFTIKDVGFHYADLYTPTEIGATATSDNDNTIQFQMTEDLLTKDQGKKFSERYLAMLWSKQESASIQKDIKITYSAPYKVGVSITPSQKVVNSINGSSPAYADIKDKYSSEMTYGISVSMLGAYSMTTRLDHAKNILWFTDYLRQRKLGNPSIDYRIYMNTTDEKQNSGPTCSLDSSDIATIQKPEEIYTHCR